MKFFTLISLFLLTICGIEEVHSKVKVTDDCTCGDSSDSRYRRIVNGQRAYPNKYPWIASLVYIEDSNEIHGCTGSIISNKNILTAANCFLHPRREIDVKEKTYWLLGMHRIGVNQGEKYKTIDHVSHPKFARFTSLDEADMAIATVDKEITFNYAIKPICLPLVGASFDGMEATVAGWGMDKFKKGTQPEVLMETSMKVLPYSECEKMWTSTVGDAVHIDSRWMVCAFRKGTDTCKGDGGAPLMVQSSEGFFELVGLNSFGFKCDASLPAIFSRVAFAQTLKWINTYLDGQEASICSRPNLFWVGSSLSNDDFAPDDVKDKDEENTPSAE